MKDEIQAAAVTVGLFALACVFAWRGDAEHAMLCAALMVPNAGQLLSAVTKGGAPKSIAEVMHEFEANLPAIQRMIASAIASPPMPGPTIFPPAEPPTVPAGPSAIARAAPFPGSPPPPPVTKG